MHRTYLEHRQADGTKLFEYFVNDVVVGSARVETSPDGRSVRRKFDAQGLVIEETHNFGKLLEFALTRKFRAGVPFEELYFRKRRLVPRRTYLTHLPGYPGMPQPGSGLQDVGADLQGLIKADRRQRRTANSAEPDPRRAAELDAFCRRLLETGDVRDANTWFDDSKARLGVRDRRASRRLLDAMNRNGAAKVWACDIQTDVDGATDTSHLVVQLPETKAGRAKLLKYLSRAAREQGLEGDRDDGQSLAYVKLE